MMHHSGHTRNIGSVFHSCEQLEVAAFTVCSQHTAEMQLVIEESLFLCSLLALFLQREENASQEGGRQVHMPVQQKRLRESLASSNFEDRKVLQEGHRSSPTFALPTFYGFVFSLSKRKCPYVSQRSRAHAPGRDRRHVVPLRQLQAYTRYSAIPHFLKIIVIITSITVVLL